MTVRADYTVTFNLAEGLTTVILPALTDVEYRLLRSMELKVNCETGYNLMRIAQVKGGDERVGS